MLEILILIPIPIALFPSLNFATAMQLPIPMPSNIWWKLKATISGLITLTLSVTPNDTHDIPIIKEYMSIPKVWKKMVPESMWSMSMNIHVTLSVYLVFFIFQYHNPNRGHHRYKLPNRKSPPPYDHQDKGFPSSH